LPDSIGVLKGLSENEALLVLNGLPQVGPVMLRRLMDAFSGDAVAVLRGDRNKLLSVKGVGDGAVDVLQQWEDHFDLSRERERMRLSGIRFVCQTDRGYPSALREIYDSPIGLYWKGQYEIDRPCVAIIGTRRATLYGRATAKKFAADLARMGFCIVSGMARGIDTAAHEAALEAEGKTIAVLGCGMDIIYPPENLELYQEISKCGAVVSEFPFGRRADRQTFPMRNRVVAGICDAVIVIESDVAGGSMITARFAGEQGRQVMAVPGRVDQTSSAGCHQLIRDGATMVTTVDEILEELRYQRPVEMELPLSGERTGGGIEMSGMEQGIIELFAGGERLSPDTICDRLERPSAEVAALLMGLELKRLVVKCSDGKFEAVR